MRKATFVVIVMIVIAITAALPLIPMATWSNSGAVKVLSDNGKIETDGDVLYYYYQGSLSTEELKALTKLSTVYKYVYVTD
jgi:hypothetical protein